MKIIILLILPRFSLNLWYTLYKVSFSFKHILSPAMMILASLLISVVSDTLLRLEGIVDSYWKSDRRPDRFSGRMLGTGIIAPIREFQRFLSQVWDQCFFHPILSYFSSGKLPSCPIPWFHQFTNICSILMQFLCFQICHAFLVHGKKIWC